MLTDYLDPHLKTLLTSQPISTPNLLLERSQSVEYAEFLYNSKKYAEAIAILSNIDTLESQWGSLACRIMLKEYDLAADAIFLMKERIESIPDANTQIIQKSWLICWSMLVIFDTAKRDLLLDMLTLPSYLVILQSKLQFAVKYVIFGFLLSKKSKKLSKDWIKIIKHDELQSSIANFVLSVYNYNVAQISESFKLGLLEVEQDVLMKPHSDEFKFETQLFILETITKVSNRVPIEMFAKAFDENESETTKIINSYTAKLDSPIVLGEKVQILDKEITIKVSRETLHESINKKLKGLESKVASLETSLSRPK